MTLMALKNSFRQYNKALLGKVTHFATWKDVDFHVANPSITLSFCDTIRGLSSWVFFVQCRHYHFILAFVRPLFRYQYWLVPYPIHFSYCIREYQLLSKLKQHHHRIPMPGRRYSCNSFHPLLCNTLNH